jgi:hypothetical protein
MASANTPLELSAEQRDLASKLALAMKMVAAVLLVLAVISIVGGVMTLLGGSAMGLLALIEGLVTGLLGLIMLSSSADVGYMVDTSYTSIHLGNAFRNLSAFYQAQFGLAIFLIIVALLRLFVG